MVSIQIAKFKFCQYQMRAVLPNLMLGKVTCYIVYIIIITRYCVPCITYI